MEALTLLHCKPNLLQLPTPPLQMRVYECRTIAACAKHVNVITTWIFMILGKADHLEIDLNFTPN